MFPSARPLLPRMGGSIVGFAMAEVSDYPVATAFPRSGPVPVGDRKPSAAVHCRALCGDERLTVSVGSHPVSRGVLVDGPTLLVSLLADAPNSEEPTVVRCAVRLFVRRVLL